MSVILQSSILISTYCCATKTQKLPELRLCQPETYTKVPNLLRLKVSLSFPKFRIGKLNRSAFRGRVLERFFALRTLEEFDRYGNLFTTDRDYFLPRYRFE